MLSLIIILTIVAMIYFSKTYNKYEVLSPLCTFFCIFILLVSLITFIVLCCLFPFNADELISQYEKELEVIDTNINKLVEIDNKLYLSEELNRKETISKELFELRKAKSQKGKYAFWLYFGN